MVTQCIKKYRGTAVTTVIPDLQIGFVYLDMK